MSTLSRLLLVLALTQIGARAETSDIGRRPWQSFANRTIALEAGLPSNGSPLALQTHDGYIWFATEAGLSRYDGVRLTTFRRHDTPALVDDWIRDLFEDASDTLWIGTLTGLTTYRNGQFASVPQMQGMNIASLTGDWAGHVWIGTVGNGVWEWTGAKFIQHADGVLVHTSEEIIRVYADSDGRLWVCRRNGGVVLLKDGKFQDFPGAAALPAVSSITEYPRGVVWLATAGGLFRYQDGALQRRDRSGMFDGNPITCVFADSAGRIWVVARSLYLALNANSDFENIPLPMVDDCRMIMEDREGSYWVGTAGSGIVRMRPSAFRVVQAAPSPGRSRSLAQASDGSVWVAVPGFGLIRLAPDGSRQTYGIGPVEDEIEAVQPGTDGSIWFATASVLGRWTSGRIDRFPQFSGIHVLYRDRRGTIWFGPASGGVQCYRDGKFISLSGKIGDPSWIVSSFAEDKRGGLWVGFANNGIVRYYDGQATTETGLPDPAVRYIYEDAAGDLWIGSKHRGLSVRHGGRWYSSDALSQPFGDLVNAITEDEAGNLWLGTARGIAWAPKRDFLGVALGEQAEIKYQIAGRGEGVNPAGVGFGYQPEWARMTDGALWFTTRAGTIAVQPKDVKPNTVAPSVVIEDVLVDGRRYPPESQLVLPPGVRSLIIKYTALSFVQPDRVAFRYRLEGHDSSWVDAGTRRDAFYSDLKPGNYHFQVIAANENGVWNQTGASFAIIQQPWFYQRWWFYLAIGFAVGATVLGMFLWRTAGLRRLVRVQTEQIRQQHEKEARLQVDLERTARLESLGVLAGGIAHDFNNLLTVIIGNVSLAKIDPEMSKSTVELLDSAELGAKRASDLTKQMLTFAKGGDPVRSAVGLEEVVREAAEFARHGGPVRCEVDVAPNLPPANADRGQISRVIHNLVLNAGEAMPQGGVVRIRLERAVLRDAEVAELRAGIYVKMSISDGGIGIAPGQLSRIFDPYFSTKAKNTGLGLATVHSIVTKHHGHVSVESALGHGTTFRIWLPAAKSSPAKAEKPASPALRDEPVRILFMDDDDLVRRTAGAILRGMGHQVTLVDDGAPAVREYNQALAAGLRFDLVILDLMVPGGMGGKATIDALLKIDPEVKAVASSGYSNDPILANYARYGFRAVVPKPYAAEVLAKVIHELVTELPPVGSP